MRHGRHAQNVAYWKQFIIAVVGVFALAAQAGDAGRSADFLPPDAPSSVPAITPFAPRPNDPALARDTGVVRWRGWGAEAFAEAARAGKPVFLFVTGRQFRWGSTMERLTFADLEVAARLNEQFIPVRLLCDRHPDVDLRLQQAIAAIAGHRGWPLTAFLTPEGRVFLGGTYFPAQADVAAARPGLRSLIQQAFHLWRDERGAVTKQTQALENALTKAVDDEAIAGAPPADILLRVALAMRDTFDAQAGGIVLPGEGPDTGRFPMPRALEVCLAHHARSGDKRSLEIARATLDAMLRGGFCDQLAGGFHRGSADRWWRIPRFGKLLTPNAEMLALLARAWQATGDERYKRAAEETLAFWTVLAGDGPYFPACQASGTSDLDDGHYDTWTVREVESVLRDDADCRLAQAFFGVEELGDLPATAPHRNALYQALPIEEAARRAGLPMADAAPRLQRARQLLARARSQRATPFVDRAILVDGNALMAAAFIECGSVLNLPAPRERGLVLLRRLLKEGVADGARHVLAGDGQLAVGPGLAQDEAALAYACTVAFEATRDQVFAEAAEAALQRLHERFWDKQRGGYLDRVEPATPQLAGGAWRVRAYRDTETPATNGLAALACARLGAATGRKYLTERAVAIVQAFGGALEKLGPYAATLTLAADAARQGPLPAPRP
jgi:hypothetical protein